MMFEHLWNDLRSLLFPGTDAAGIPTMDGALTPNAKLESAQVVGEPIIGCDDLALADDGSIYASSARRVLRIHGRGLAGREVVAEFDGTVCGLAWAAGRLYAGVSGEGLVVLEAGQEIARLRTASERPLDCITAICPLPDGSLMLSEGSAQEPPSRWNYDLMRRGASGRLVQVSPDCSRGTTVVDGLAWPYGLALNAEASELWYTESWRHRLSGARLSNLAQPRALIPDLPGYPARISRAADGSFWLALFAVRTQLVEHVLRETKFREDMVATIDPELWVAPVLRSQGGYLEPLQMGSIKKLGMMKPWAPPRSYGLIVHLSASGEPMESFHSRVGGQHHGLTAVLERDGRLWIASKGSEQLLEFPLKGA
jgi:hypothetical protein